MTKSTETQLTPLQRALVAVREMRARLNAVEEARYEPIAIVGAGCRFPGGVNSPTELWSHLANDRDLVTPVPASRWDVEAVYEQYPNEEVKNATSFGSFIDDVEQFDAQSFGISPREAASIDPQQRLLLETSWEALENAGIAPFSLEGSRTGVYVGISTNDYEQVSRDSLQHIDRINAYIGTGTTFSVAAGRIAYILGLNGPALAVDTACSSALVAVHLACQSLRNQQTDIALAGGVNLVLRADTSVYMMTMGALSPTGRCRTFAANADGYVRGEGAGVVVLKRLSDAKEAGDNILAVIRGTAINHDGRSSGLTVPNGNAQQDVIRAALADTGNLSANDIGYVEAHGTGTPLGDPIELRALAAVYGRNRSSDPLKIGSIKTNLGHLEAAAGIAGLIKVILSLQNKALPKHLHFGDPSPHFDWDQAPLTVVDKYQPWQAEETALRAGLSSFGFSGTNAHIIIEEAPTRALKVRGEINRPLHLLTLSARTNAALKQLTTRYQEFLPQSTDHLADIAHTANVGRSHFDERIAIIATDIADVSSQLAGEDSFGTGRYFSGSAYARGQKRIAFLFTGQGSQYVGMARTLYETQPTFRATIDECAEILAPFMDTPLLDILFAAEGDERIHQTGFTQPALFVIEYALAKMWQGWGIQPTLLIGHSIGELVAACVAGIFSLADGLRLAAKRGALMQALPAGGAMLVVFANEDTVNDYVQDLSDVAIAAVNSPGTIVISGSGTSVEAVRVKLAAAKIRNQPLTVSHAFHSPLMEPMLADFAAEAEQVTYHPPRIRIASTVSGTVAKGSDMSNAAYWRNQIRQPVRFAAAAQALAASKIEIALEIGPTPTLVGLGRRSLPETELTWLPSLNRKRGDWETLLEAVAKLYVQGVDIDWTAFDADYERNRVQLPTYAFDRQRFWMAPSESEQARSQVAGHPLLGMRLSSALQSVQFESRINVTQRANLSGKQTEIAKLSPGIAISLALQAVHESHPADLYALQDFMMLATLDLDKDESVFVQTVVTSTLGKQKRVEIFARAPQAESWTAIARSEVVLDNERIPNADFEALRSLSTVNVELSSWLTEQGSAQLDAKRYAEVIEGISQGNNSYLIAFKQLPISSRFVQYPLYLDIGLQMLAGEANMVASVALVESTAQSLPQWCHVDRAARTLQYFDEQGQIVAQMGAVSFAAESAALSNEPRNEWLYEMGWRFEPQLDWKPLIEEPWLLVVDEETADHEALLTQLANAGAVARVAQATELLSEVSTQLDTLLDDATPLKGIIWLAATGKGQASKQHLGIESERQTGRFMQFVKLIAAKTAQRQLTVAPAIWVLTQSAVSFETDQLTVEQSALWGLGRTLALELTRNWGGLIDLPAAPSMHDWQAAVQAVANTQAEHEIVVRDGQLYVGRLRSIDATELTAETLNCHVDGTYLIAGGLGALGLTVAQWLVERGARHLILLGRSALPARQSWYDLAPSDRFAETVAVIRTLEAAGVHVHLGSVDVANRDELQRYIETYESEGWPAIRGVVHAAGVLRDQLFDSLTVSELSKVMRPKAAGGWNLHELTLDKSLDFFIAFSSVAAVTGSVGQANYGAANQFLNGLVARRRLENLPALSVNWGPWDVGMAAAPEVVARRERLGIGVISQAAGCQLLTQLVASDRVSPTVMPIAPTQWVQLYPKHIRTFADLTAEPVVAKVAVENTVSLLQAATGQERQELIAELLTDRISTVLRIDAAELAAERNVMELGLDSIMVMELLEKLNRDLAMTLYAREVFEQPSISQLSKYLTLEFEKTHQNVPDEPAAKVMIADLIPDRQFAAAITPESRVPNTVLLLSSPRAGSTLLRVMLQGHPDLFCPPELHLLPFESLTQREQELEGSYLAEGLQRALMELRGLSAESSKQLLDDWSASDKSVLDVYQELVDEIKPQLLIDKSPTYGMDINILNRAERLFDDAKYIHLVRHPYAVMDSFIKNRMERLFGAQSTDSMSIAEDTWTTINSNIADFLEGVDSSRHHFVRYEDLVVEPERVLNEICQFLNITFTAEMLNPYDGHRMTDGVHENSMGIGDPNFLKRQTIDAKLADSWRNAHFSRRPSRALRSLADEFDYETPWPSGSAPANLTPKDSASLVALNSDREQLPLSYAQKRLWFLDQLDPGTPSLNIHASVRINGAIDLSALQQSLNSIVTRQASLRTQFVYDSGEPSQRILPPYELAIEKDDLAHLAGDAQQLALAESLRVFNQTGFDLSTDRLIRVKLIELDAQTHVLALVMHHIISDGWSLNLFFRELGVTYDALLYRQQPELPELPLQYSDFATWQNSWLNEEPRQRQLDYWREKLAAPRQITELPADYRRPPIQMHEGDQLGLTMSPKLTTAIKQASRDAGVTPFMFLLAAFKLLLFRHIGQEDIIVGAPIAGREQREFRGLIGLFLNSLILRTQFDEKLDFASLLERVKETTLGAYKHQDIPFEMLLNALQTERDMSRTPFFQIFFNMLNFVDQKVEMSGLDVETITTTERGSKFDLTCYVVDRVAEFELLLVYDTMLFKRERIEELSRQYILLLEQIVVTPAANILAYSLVTEPARQLLPDASEILDRTYHGSVPAALNRQAELRPQALAIVDEHDQWSYEALAQNSNRLSHYLINNGVKSGDIVVVYGHRSASLVWAVMGVLGAGAAFVILDPAYPSNRLIDYMTLAQPKGWLQISEAGEVSGDIVAALDELPLQCRLELPRLEKVIADNMLHEQPSSAPDVEIQADDLAYVSFTSGSTGRPKGVLGRHGSLTHFTPWQMRQFKLSPADRFSMLSGLAHDPLQRDMFTSIWVGGTIVVPNPAKVVTPGWLGQWFRDEKVTIAHLTPAMLQLIADSSGERELVQIESLRHAFFVGDVLSRRDVGRFCKLAPNLEVVNFYGSTETQRAVGYFPVPVVEDHETLPAEERVQYGPMLKEIIPLGVGMPDSQILVLNNQHQAAGVGEAGEVYMRSGHIALGYLGDSDMTAERFLNNPATNDEADLMYRTGDLGRYGPDGVVEFIGRADHQVKLRGYRIELGEIEASLGHHEAVREVVVLLWEGNRGKEIVAFIVLNPGNEPEASELRQFLKARLPDYMVPSQFVLLDEIPLTPNRKIDRRQLMALEITPMRQSEGVDERPLDELERQLIKLWEAELRVPTVSVHDNFFELGGHSLLGMSLFAKMESTLGHTLPASALFLAPTIRELADMIRRGEKGELLWSSLVPIQSGGRNQPFFYVSPFLISVLSLANLGRYLGEDQPLYGLQPQGLDGQGEIHSSINDMAAHYIKEIKSVQPSGPYYIGGHCSGNWVAFEIAQQLKAQGDTVASLVMVDSGPPNIERPPIRPVNYIMRRLWLYVRSGRLKHAVVWQARVLFGRFVLYRVGTKKLRQTEAVREAHRRAYSEYHTVPYDGDILFLRSQESTQLRDKDWHLRWSEMIKGEVDIDVVSSTHADLLEEPFVQELAIKIRKYLPFEDESL